MVEIQDIQDRDTLKAWLDQVIADKGEKEGRGIAVFIAHRAAMRTLPIYWRWTQTSQGAREHDMTSMPVLRASLISGVAGKMPKPELGKAAGATTRATVATTGTAAAARATADAIHAAYAAAFAHASARATASATATANANATARAAAQAASAAATAVAHATTTTAAEVWVEVGLDAVAAAEVNANSLSLWSGDNPLADVWAETKSVTQSAPEGPTHWSFWRRWYDGALKGGPPRNPELLKAVALIDPEDWEKGPGFINDVKIPELEALYGGGALEAATPESFPSTPSRASCA